MLWYWEQTVLTFPDDHEESMKNAENHDSHSLKALEEFPSSEALVIIGILMQDIMIRFTCNWEPIVGPAF